MKNTNKQNDAKKFSPFGRPRAVTKADVLKAIHEHKTTSAAALSKILDVNPATIYRRLNLITHVETETALGTAKETQLKPAQMNFEVFMQIPEVKQLYETLRYMRKCGERYTMRMVRGLFRICKVLKIQPTALEPKEAAELLLKIRKGEAPIQENETKKAIRAWFMFRGVSAQKLTDLGVDGRSDRIGRDRATSKLSAEQRARFMAALRERTKENWSSNGYKIPFKDEPQLAAAVLQIPLTLYYTGTRVGKDNTRGLLSMTWQQTSFTEGRVIITVVDKGKRGGITWHKTLLGDAAKEFKNFYEAIGQPKEGLIFPFGYNTLRSFFIECYRAAQIPANIWKGMPLHIWRHSAAQDFLEASEWNLGLTAKTLGWETTHALEKHYGKMPDTTQQRGLMKAMGYTVTEKRGEFRF